MTKREMLLALADAKRDISILQHSIRQKGKLATRSEVTLSGLRGRAWCAKQAIDDVLLGLARETRMKKLADMKKLVDTGGEQ